MSRDDYEWRMTMGATLFEFRSVKLPRTPSESDDGDEIAALEGRALDRIGLIDMAVKTVDELFRMFLMLRTAPDWDQEIVRIRQWIHSATQN
jgi:recombination associated protein RdgC